MVARKITISLRLSTAALRTIDDKLGVAAIVKRAAR